MGRQAKLIFGFAAGLIVGAYLVKSARDSYRESVDAKELGIDYQAQHAEELGRPFPTRVANRHRRAVEKGLSAPSYFD